MKYDRDIARLEMHHAFYRRQIYDRNKVSTARRANSPYLPHKGRMWDDARHLPLLHNFWSNVASWIYDCNTACPIITHPLSKLCQRMHDPSQHDDMALDQFMRFMANHIDTPLVMQRSTADKPGEIHMSSFTDSSFADPDDPKARATKGATHSFGQSPVMWGAIKSTYRVRA
jgi:hypothetical protein